MHIRSARTTRSWSSSTLLEAWSHHELSLSKRLQAGFIEDSSKKATMKRKKGMILHSLFLFMTTKPYYLVLKITPLWERWGRILLLVRNHMDSKVFARISLERSHCSRFSKCKMFMFLWTYGRFWSPFRQVQTRGKLRRELCLSFLRILWKFSLKLYETFVTNFF